MALMLEDLRRKLRRAVRHGDGYDNLQKLDIPKEHIGARHTFRKMMVSHIDMTQWWWKVLSIVGSWLIVGG